MEGIEDKVTFVPKTLTEDEKRILKLQDSRPLSEFAIKKFDKDVQKHWDLFYKRNCERFFKNRHWTVREFEELLQGVNGCKNKSLLEIGCGVGNLIYPLVDEKVFETIYACDFSPRAVQLVKENPRYDPSIINVFQSDLTEAGSLTEVIKQPVDIVTMVFVLSAINPINFNKVIKNIASVTRPGSLVFFRDYGLYDMAQFRFKPGHKISEQYYVRQDGTKTYFFTIEEIRRLFQVEGFTELSNTYVNRRTINRKEEIDVPRIFIQGKFRKN